MTVSCEKVGTECFESAPTCHRATVEITASSEQVFAVLLDADAWVRWAWPITAVEWTSGFPIEVASTRTVHMRARATSRSATTRTPSRPATFIDVDGVRHAVPGDLARMELDGTMTLLGRGSQCINSGGEKTTSTIFEGTSEIQRLVIARAIFGVRIGQPGDIGTFGPARRRIFG